MLENYFPVLLFIVIALVMGVAPLVLGWLVAPFGLCSQVWLLLSRLLKKHVCIKCRANQQKNPIHR